VRTRRVEPITDMIAPTERCPWRKRVLCGEVHDDNAYAGRCRRHGLLPRRATHTTLTASRCWTGADDSPPAIVHSSGARPSIRGLTWIGWDTKPTNSASARVLA
jgi:hypothetical protein